MNVSASGTPTLCRRCGQISTGTAGSCAHCGSPVGGPAGTGERRPVPIVDGPVHRFAPAAVTSGPELRLSRKTGLRVAAAGGVLVLVVAAVLLLWEPPSPAGTVEDYLERLGDGDTAAALEVSGYGTGFAPDEAPLLVPAALADAADRPADITVTDTRELDGEGRYSVVTATYKLGGQSIRQDFAVVATEDDETPYRLEQPFLFLIVDLPDGMDVTVNGIAVDPSAATSGTPAFPGTYRATTNGNALFAGATATASYGSGSWGTTAEIDLGRPGLAPGAEAAVQSAAETYLTTACVTTGTYRYGCPVQAPSVSWSQTTTWVITTNPQLRVAPADDGRNRVRFSTGVPGSAAYTTTYTEFGGTEKTETGTVPIDIDGSAALGDDGTITITLGY